MGPAFERKGLWESWPCFPAADASASEVAPVMGTPPHPLTAAGGLSGTLVCLWPNNELQTGIGTRWWEGKGPVFSSASKCGVYGV